MTDSTPEPVAEARDYTTLTENFRDALNDRESSEEGLLGELLDSAVEFFTPEEPIQPAAGQDVRRRVTGLVRGYAVRLLTGYAGLSAEDAAQALIESRPSDTESALLALITEQRAEAVAEDDDYWWGRGWRSGYDDGLRDSKDSPPPVGSGKHAEDIPVRPER